MTPAVIWGASGHARVLNEFLPRLGFQLIALFDNDRALASPFAGVPLYHGEEGFRRWAASEAGASSARCLVAIGGDRGRERLALQRLMQESGLRPMTAVHPSAVVAGGAELGEGCHVLAHATVGADARLGKACILNTSSSVDHECELGDGVHIAPGAVLAGCVRVGAHTLVATGAVVLPRVRIGADAVIGAGAVVTRDVPDGVVAYGNPARVVRPNKAREAR